MLGAAAWGSSGRAGSDASRVGRLLLGLDFDGTLAPLAKRPELARLPRGTRRLLERLLLGGRVRVAVVSGRALSDVKRKVGIEGIIYSGNHGLEIQLPGRARWVHPNARPLAKIVARVAAQIRPRLKEFPGAQLEEKVLSLSLHYRNLKEFLSPRPLRDLLKGIVGADAAFLRLGHGKKVWELRPRLRWNKGDALLRLAGSNGAAEPWTIAFVGDDQNDEEGFRRLGPGALTVHVGVSRRSRAAFRLKRQKQVAQFLEFVLKEWSAPAPGLSRARR